MINIDPVNKPILKEWRRIRGAPAGALRLRGEEEEWFKEIVKVWANCSNCATRQMVEMWQDQEGLHYQLIGSKCVHCDDVPFGWIEIQDTPDGVLAVHGVEEEVA